MYHHLQSLVGAGNFPRHTEMLSKLSSRNENMAKFGAENPSDKNNMLWRADWGLKQWIPYLLGKPFVLKFCLYATVCSPSLIMKNYI